MNSKKIFFLLFFGVFVLKFSAFSQLSANYEAVQEYNMALELYEKDKFGAAYQKFIEFTTPKFSSDNSLKYNDLKINAEFYAAACAQQLDKENAESMLSNFIEQHPTHSKSMEAWFYLASIQFNKKNYGSFLSMSKNVKQKLLNEKQSKDYDFMQAYALFATGKEEQSAPIWKKVMEQDDDYKVHASYYYAYIKYKNNGFNEALKTFRTIEESPEYQKTVPIYIANCLMKLKKYDELETYVQKIEKSSLEIDNKEELYIILASTYFRQGKYSEAIKAYEKYMLKKGELNRDQKYQLAVSYYNTKAFHKSIKLFEEVITELDFTSQSAAYLLGFAYHEIGNNEEARLAFHNASENTSDPSMKENALYEYAKLSYETKYFEEAIKAFKEIVASTNDVLRKNEARELIGNSYYYGSNYVDAIKYYEQSNLSSSQSKVAYQNALLYDGFSNFEKKNYKQAIARFRKVVNQTVNPKLGLQAKFWTAEAYAELKNYNQAEKSYDWFLKSSGATTDQNYALAYYGKAYAQYQQSAYAVALGTFMKFLEVSKNSPYNDYKIDARLRAGDCEFIAKNYQDAINFYESVSSVNKKGSDYALFQTGSAYYRINKYKESANSYKTLLTKYPTSDFHDDAYDKISEIYLTWIIDYPKAVKYSEDLIQKHPKSEFVPNAYNRIAIASYNAEDEKKAEINFKKVVFDYGTANEAVKVALDGLGNILDATDYDKLLKDYKKKYPQTNEALDDISISTAKDRYYDENYASAFETFDDYVKTRENAKYYYEALYFRGLCSKKLEKSEDASKDFKKLYEELPRNAFTVPSINEAAIMQFELGNYNEALTLYQKMETIADALPNKLKASFGLGESLFKLEKYNESLVVYDSLIQISGMTEFSSNRAKVEKGRVLLQLQQYDNAKKVLTEVENNTSNLHGVMAQYYICEVLYAKGEYEQCKNAVIYLKDTYPNRNFYKAKAYLVMSDAYKAEGNDFQAKETLKSIIENYPFEDIKKIAEQKLKNYED